MPKQVIGSWKEAQTVVPVILDRLNADPPLLLAALANPLLALEELGYEIAPSFREELIDRVRFGTRDAARIRQLREEIFRHAGGSFDLDSPVETEHVLFERLKLPRPGYSAGKQALHGLEFSFGHDHEKDPIEGLRGQHALVDSLLDFRRLDSRAPKLAPRELFEEIKAGKHRLPLTRVHVRLKTREEHEKV